ncbi:hypothetical protein HPB48_013138 [Haemaphysalis longicornis]|uniref:Carboxylesterase type B domain-containing protein n=1 Tax=Haemaphysalis longicornis TaxID=44386 RepID=A0A9J6FH26_HAELO|nr:hypothetical protein HPB48_013138 [Haemaphysalis longicornis]
MPGEKVKTLQKRREPSLPQVHAKQVTMQRPQLGHATPADPRSSTRPASPEMKTPPPQASGSPPEQSIRGEVAVPTPLNTAARPFQTEATATPEDVRPASSPMSRPRNSSAALEERNPTTTATGTARWRFWSRGTIDDKSRGIGNVMQTKRSERTEQVCRLLYTGLFATFLVLFTFFVWHMFAPTRDLRVRTLDGIIPGSLQEVEGRKVYTYLGLPYATPPVRFQSAAALHHFRPKDVVPARPHVRCLQAPLNDTSWPLPPPGSGEVVYDEDCLYLNVWSPVPPCDYMSSTCSSAVPVVVFMFSLGFGRGGGDWYDGSVLATMGGVVVVAPNFRLGPLGLPMTSATTEPTPMLWSSDQLLALKWTRDNAKHFGGDSSCITLMGAGGGAWTVGELLLSNRANVRDYVRRAILHGESPLRMYETPSAKTVAKVLGCKPYSLECLQSADASLLDDLASRHFLGPPPNLMLEHQSTPLIHGDILLGFAAGRGEALLADFLNDFANGSDLSIDEFKAVLEEHFNFTADEVAALDVSRKDAWPTFLENLLIRCPVEQFSDVARNMFRSYGFVYVENEQESDLGKRAIPQTPHPELDLIFGVPIIRPSREDTKLKEASRKYVHAWSHFMKTGMLPMPGGNSWPPVIEESVGTAVEVVINAAMNMTVPPRFASKTCEQIQKALRRYLQEDNAIKMSDDGHHVHEASIHSPFGGKRWK